MKFIKRPDLTLAKRIHIAMRAPLCQGTYGAMSQLVNQHEISRGIGVRPYILHLCEIQGLTPSIRFEGKLPVAKLSPWKGWLKGLGAVTLYMWIRQHKYFQFFCYFLCRECAFF